MALGHVTREYPNKLDHVLAGPADLRGPRDLHPVFYGSFDWHSCVHGYWMLAHLYRRFPAMAPCERHPRAVRCPPGAGSYRRGECAYLARPSAGGFERPYGWAWLLYLAAELRRTARRRVRRGPLPWRRWRAIFADRFSDFLPRATYPIRAGVHGNTAFALLLAMDYPDAALRPLLTRCRVALVRRRRRLPGVGARRRRVPVAGADRGGVHAGRFVRTPISARGSRASCRGCSSGSRRRCSCRPRSATAPTARSSISMA